MADKGVLCLPRLICFTISSTLTHWLEATYEMHGLASKTQVSLKCNGGGPHCPRSGEFVHYHGGTLSWWPQPPNQHLQTWLLSCFCSLNCLLESSIEMICSHRKFSYSIHSKINISVVLTHTTILSMEAISFAFQSQIPNEFC